MRAVFTVCGFRLKPNQYYKMVTHSQKAPVSYAGAFWLALITRFLLFTEKEETAGNMALRHENAVRKNRTGSSL